MMSRNKAKLIEIDYFSLRFWMAKGQEGGKRPEAKGFKETQA